MARTRKPTKAALVEDAAIDPTLAETAPQAFEAARAEIIAIPSSMFLPINLDIPRAAGRGILAAERMRPLLPSLSTLPQLDLKRIENLQTYSLALLYCHELATEGGLNEEPTLADLLGEAVPLRESMLRTAELLVHFGLASVERVAAIRSGRGHADTADGLLSLGRLFLELWTRIHDKVLITRTMVDRAIVLGGQLRKVLAAREIAADPLAQPGSRRYLRAQAYALFAQAYEECVRGVSFVRWYEGDTHRIVPTLYPRKSSKTKGSKALAEGLPETSAEHDDTTESVPISIPILLAEITTHDLAAND